MFRIAAKNKNGITMVELMIAITILLVVIVPLTKVLFSSLRGAMSFGDANKAIQLAQDLMEEIKQKKWDENEPAGGGQTPAGSYSAIGTDGGGEILGNKTTYDDIDDYNGLIETPPRDINNTIIPNSQKFTRQVTVQYVNVPDGGSISLAGGTTDYKQIIVTVDWQGRISGLPVRVTTVRANIKRY